MLELYTERLFMRQLIETDWPLFLALHSDQDITRYVCEAPSPLRIREMFESRLPLWLPTSDHWLCLVVIDKQYHQPLGLTGLKILSQEVAGAEVGYMFLAEQQGKGYASESLQQVMSHARDALNLRVLKATVTDGNTSSCRVLEKCDFLFEYRVPQAFCMGDQLVDDLVFQHSIRDRRSRWGR